MFDFIVTGGAGFIGSAFVWKLNQEGIDNILIVDDLGETEKWKNLVNLRYAAYMHKSKFLSMVQKNQLPGKVKAIVHMGACSSTTERNADYLMENNTDYTWALAHAAREMGARFIYASSAAAYGDGSLGFSDDDGLTMRLKPLNMYGYSKLLFDQHALKHDLTQKMAGVRFFNVFGPNEYHKGDMASVIFKAYYQIRDAGRISLFKSYHPDYADGTQMRDFVYVKDCVEVLWWLINNELVNGIFNLGTGKARTWNDLARSVFSALNREPDIDYVEMPESLRGKYQYFTEATMDKLRGVGCPVICRPLEEAVADYVSGYLEKNQAAL